MIVENFHTYFLHILYFKRKFVALLQSIINTYTIKLMKKAKILLLLMYFACCAYAQKRHVKYSYDASGNRISRTIVIDSNRSKQKSTNIDKDITCINGVNVSIHSDDFGKFLTLSVNTTDIKSMSYLLYTTNGSICSKGKVSNNTTHIDTSSLANGIYVLKVIIGEECMSWKVIKK